MPVYDYKCEACGAEFEVERSFGATSAVKCACGSSKTAKVFSAAGIVFKGSGFHVTDYKANGGESKTTSKPAESKPTESAPAASDSAPKPASKPAKSSGDD